MCFTFYKLNAQSKLKHYMGNNSTCISAAQHLMFSVTQALQMHPIYVLNVADTLTFRFLSQTDYLQ